MIEDLKNMISEYWRLSLVSKVSVPFLLFAAALFITGSILSFSPAIPLVLAGVGLMAASLGIAVAAMPIATGLVKIFSFFTKNKTEPVDQSEPTTRHDSNLANRRKHFPTVNSTTETNHDNKFEDDNNRFEDSPAKNCYSSF